MDGSISEHGDRVPSLSVVGAVAEANGCGETDLPPLYGSIDPEVLDEAVTTVPGVEIHFSYAGHEVAVRGDSVDVDGERAVTVDGTLAVDEQG